MALTAHSTIGEWLNDSTGGELIRGLLAQSGTNEESLTPGRFAGKTVIVTGAASGIGRATASRIAREGGRVIAADISAAKLDALKAEFADADLTVVAGDLTQQSAIDEVITAAGDHIDGLANVAGINDDRAARGIHHLPALRRRREHQRCDRRIRRRVVGAVSTEPGRPGRRARTAPPLARTVMPGCLSWTPLAESLALTHRVRASRQKPATFNGRRQ